MSTRKYNYWVPLADLMTVLMVLFLFMAISYMVVIRKKYTSNDKIIQEYHNTKKDLVADLSTGFKKDLQGRNDMVLDSNNLSIKFIDRKILFDFDKSNLKDEFRKPLADFLPRFLDIVLQKKYADKIAEVRIEGHTSSEGDYFYNMRLSQDRTRNVMSFLFDMDYYHKLAAADRQRLQYWLTANGMSYGRTVDKDGHDTYLSGQPADNASSRRVEFKIVTKSEASLTQAYNALNNK